MTLKRKIDKEAFDALSDGLKALYVEKDGVFHLDMEDEDAGALLRAKEHEKESRKKAESEVKALREKLAQLEEDGMRKRGDVEALDKSWAEKHSKAIQEIESKYLKLKNSIRKQLLETQARAIASEISTVPTLMAKALMERLEVDFDSENGPSIRVLDSTGKPSALSLDELKGEFVANKDFASIIIGSKASGGGATDKSFKSASGVSEASKPLTQMSPSELAAHIKAFKGE